MNRFKLLVVLLLSFSVIQSCDNDSNDNSENTSRVQLKLVDEPGDYLEVNVEIIDIQYNASDDEGWSSLTPASGYPINVDLTELVAGNDLLLVDEILPSGNLNQIRLVLSDNNNLVIEDENGEPSEPIQLNTPSAQQSGLKLNLNEELEPGFTYTFVLDWVVQESIVQAGNSGNYNLKPVIRVNAEVNSGSISGTVVENIDDTLVPFDDITVGLYALDDTLITDTMTDENGNFLLQALDAGSYIVRITVDGYQPYESAELTVEAGELLDLGIIELLPVE